MWPATITHFLKCNMFTSLLFRLSEERFLFPGMAPGEVTVRDSKKLTTVLPQPSTKSIRPWSVSFQCQADLRTFVLSLRHMQIQEYTKASLLVPWQLPYILWGQELSP